MTIHLLSVDLIGLNRIITNFMNVLSFTEFIIVNISSIKPPLRLLVLYITDY